MSSPPAIVVDALARLVAGSSRAAASDADPAERHRVEYRRPSIWIWRRIVGVAFAFVVVTMAWYLVKVPDGLVSDETLPTLTQVASALDELWVDGFAGASLAAHVVASLARLVLGLLIGVTLGSLLGLTTGSSPLLRTVVDPIGSAARMIPAVALTPLLILWLGPGDVAIVGAVSAAVLLASMDAVDTIRIRRVRRLDDDLVHQLTAGFRRAIGTGWAAVLAVETIMAPDGLGPMIWSAQRRADVIVAGLCVVGLIGLILDGGARAVGYLVSTPRSGRDDWFDGPA